MLHIITGGDNLKKKKNAKKFKKILSVFDGAGIEYAVHLTADKADVIKTAGELTAGSGNTVVAVGGDGTLHDVLNGFENFEGNLLGLIPFGTGNDFAAAAHIPVNVKKAAAIIAKGNSGFVDFIQFSSGLRSINAAGMGIDVDVLERAYAGKNQKKSKYLKAALTSLRKYKSAEFVAEYNGKREKHFGLIAAVGNGRQIGGGIKVFPESKIDDGYLNLVIVDYLSRFGTVKAFIKLMLGKINKVKNVTAVTTKEVKFYSLSENYTIQADGELYPNTPIEARIAENKLRFILP